MTDRKVKLQNEIEQLSPEELEKEIENNKRCIYGGAIGYIYLSGNVE